MVNRPKQIGTQSETGVRNALLRAGFSLLEAHRNVLKGSEDEGDVWLRHPSRGLFIFEVKGGKSAEAAGPKKIAQWLAETEKEMYAAGAQHGFLVRKKKGVSHLRAEDYEAYIDLVDLLGLTGAPVTPELFPWQANVVMQIRFGDLLKLIKVPENQEDAAEAAS
jgi:hypothetical protein